MKVCFVCLFCVLIERKLEVAGTGGRMTTRRLPGSQLLCPLTALWNLAHTHLLRHHYSLPECSQDHRLAFWQFLFIVLCLSFLFYHPHPYLKYGCPSGFSLVHHLSPVCWVPQASPSTAVITPMPKTPQAFLFQPLHLAVSQAQSSSTCPKWDSLFLTQICSPV